MTPEEINHARTLKQKRIDAYMNTLEPSGRRPVPLPPPGLVLPVPGEGSPRLFVTTSKRLTPEGVENLRKSLEGIHKAKGIALFDEGIRVFQHVDGRWIELGEKPPGFLRRLFLPVFYFAVMVYRSIRGKKG